jgi:hypothetical protein
MISSSSVAAEEEYKHMGEAEAPAAFTTLTVHLEHPV